MTLTQEQMQQRDEDLDRLNSGTFFKTDSRTCQYWYKIFDDGSLRIGYQVYLNHKPIFENGDDGFYIANKEKLVGFANTNRLWFQICDNRNSWHW